MDCKPYYVIILSLVCGGAALLSLLSLASMIRLNIGILPKGMIKLILFPWPLVCVTVIITSLIVFIKLGYERIASDTEEEEGASDAIVSDSSILA